MWNCPFPLQLWLKYTASHECQVFLLLLLLSIYLLYVFEIFWDFLNKDSEVQTGNLD